MSYTEYRAQEKPVSEKIHQACRKATQLGLAYIWIDTWCIDQNNAHEIAKNIESMYSYYRNSAVCLVYLFDKYIFSPDLWQSEWFRRGWTLLELLAPQEELFFDMTWTCVGSRGDMKQGIHMTTNIDTEVLDGTISFKDVDAQKKIFWIRNRFTSRPHDLAYSVLEIFDIKLGPDYSENVENTFQQMQSELLRGHPNLSPSTLFNELTCAFLATGHPVPPISWPARQVEVSAHMVLLHLSVNKLSQTCPQRLIEISSLQITEFHKNEIIPPYAILSMFTFYADGELSCSELTNACRDHESVARQKLGFKRIQQACLKARQLGLEYIYVPLLCLDQRDQDFLHNFKSIHAYYRNSALCLVYLWDVSRPGRSSFQSDYWYTVDWTIFELLAPQQEVFFDRDWHFVHNRATYMSTISVLTGVREEILEGIKSIKDVHVWERLSWLARGMPITPEGLTIFSREVLGLELEPIFDEPFDKTIVRLTREPCLVHPDVSAEFVNWSLYFSSQPPMPPIFPEVESKVILSTLAYYLLHLQVFYS